MLQVFHNRSYVSTQRRNELGISTVTASLIQIHALRAKGSLDAFTGTKLHMYTVHVYIYLHVHVETTVYIHVCDY